MIRWNQIQAGLLWSLLVLSGGRRAAGADSSAEVEFFEKRIRPLLVQHCHSCHSEGSEKLKGGLRLDSRQGLEHGGDSGPSVIPGDPDNSPLIQAVRYQDKHRQMPPKNRKLPDRQIQDLVAWVRMGAPWPDGTRTGSALPVAPGSETTEQAAAWWAFKPVERPGLPPLRQPAWVLNPVDAFVLAQLEAHDLAPNPPAAKRELIRRVYADLLGLPPLPEAVTAFENDCSPAAFEKLVDRLLALPQYGERWARHWLDVVRYAQSNGYERDGEKPLAWRYRDYVIRSFNMDKPYNRFVMEQIAGDELPDAGPDCLIATGFQRLGVWDDEPDDKQMAEFDELDDIVSTTGTAFLGLTVGCARCHDHKFDPIPQADYYQLLAFFRNVRPSENARYLLDSPNYAPLAPLTRVTAWEQEREERIRRLEDRRKSATNDTAAKKEIEEMLKRVNAEVSPFEWALGVRERGGQPPPTHILVRGNPRTPGGEVQPAFPKALASELPQLPAPGPENSSSGRRLALANWLASAQNPLTARVMVNRLWQHHFGRGIVTTTTDFGRAGIPPTHPRLLDWLASEFMSAGWLVKKLQRTILLSNAYRMSSQARNPKAEGIDPGNGWLWRQNLRRLEAEAIRDTILHVSGRLVPTMGGRGFFPHLAGEVLAGASRPGQDWERSNGEDQLRRSVYIYIRRTMLVPALENYDYSNTASPLGERPTTTVAPQALMLLNDDFINQQAAAFAARLRTEAGGQLPAQIRRAYKLAFSREPTAREMETCASFVHRQAAAARGIRTRLTFQPDVPTSLLGTYLEQLHPSDFLRGPSAGWNHYRGRWSAVYEGIRTVERQRGPFVLWTGCAFEDGVIEARMALDRGSEFGSVLVRATAEGDEQRGYEVTLDRRQQRVLVRRHATALSTLAEMPAFIAAARPIPLRIEVAGASVRVWLDGSPTPLIEVTDPSPLPSKGYVGVRTWGAPFSIDDLTLTTKNRTYAVHSHADAIDAPENFAASELQFEQEALHAFCRLVLNLNEMIYVD